MDRDLVGAGDGGQLGDRLHRADLVVGPHDADQRDRAGVGRERRLEGRRVDPAGRVDRQPLDLGALVLGQPERRVHDRVVLDGAGEDPGPARVGGPPAPVEALDGEVVRLGAAAGEEHLAGPGADGLGERLAGLLDQPAGGPAGACSEDGLPTVPRHRVIASTASGTIGVLAAWSR